MSSKTYVNFKTPRGVVQYPRLDKPYRFDMAQNRSVPDPDGQFETGLVISKADAKPLIDAIDLAIEKSGVKPNHLPYKEDKENGTVIFKLKAYGKTKDGKPTKLMYRDSKLKELPSSFVPNAGSEIYASGYVSVAKMGARLNLKEIQVLKYVAKPTVFSEEEDGFEYDGEDYNDNNETETTVAETSEKAEPRSGTDF